MQGCLPCRKVRANPRHFIKMASSAEQCVMPTVSQQSSRWPGGRQDTGGIYQLLSCFKVCNDNFSLKGEV